MHYLVNRWCLPTHLPRGTTQSSRYPLPCHMHTPRRTALLGIKMKALEVRVHFRRQRGDLPRLQFRIDKNGLIAIGLVQAQFRQAVSIVVGEIFRISGSKIIMSEP